MNFPVTSSGRWLGLVNYRSIQGGTLPNDVSIANADYTTALTYDSAGGTRVTEQFHFYSFCFESNRTAGTAYVTVFDYTKSESPTLRLQLFEICAF